ncbi:hypothetical protein [Hymenobacter psychrophilus]|uniref:Uncharacterized protein n=1 Tax=Hymenobacter psychrophilus TaxID=651662 RepID=A0A1H3GQX9_9BACT|nr:hypothetical protein [Hymenobacter psychrophilus]SDY05681.1 hypothetical protein SAMN04488069_105135 [Hymenobacter psychrophilus]
MSTDSKNSSEELQNEHNRTQQQVANNGNNTPRPENVGGVSVQQQGGKSLTSAPTPEGDHGGNRGGTHNDSTQSAEGSSNRGGQPGADQKNDGGGADAENANQTKNTTAYNTEYSNARSAPSSANDGGKMGDADNPA